MELFTLNNVVAHAIQVACLAALATGLAAILRVDAAAVRYTYWRLVLAAALVLPWVQPLRVPASAPVGTASMEVGVDVPGVAAAVGGSTSSVTMFDWTAAAVVLFVAGMLVRLLWVGAGLISLRRLRGLGVRAVEEPQVVEVQDSLRTRADVRYVAGLKQPATFGLRRPVVLLPDTVREEPPGIQRALLCHELLHVQRRDWFWVFCEELVLAAFWFNPAIWWLVGQIRVAREEAVDELTVLATGSRRTYVKALLAFAEDAPLAPAPAFAHRRHLFRRITLLSREAVMSSKRIVSSCAVMALVLVAGGWYAASAFPLTAEPEVQAVQQEPGPLERRANAISRENPIPRRTDYQVADYPAEARALGLSGAITLRITLDEVGRIAEARRTGFSFETSAPKVRASFYNATPDSVEQSLIKEYGETGAKSVLVAIDAMTASAANAARQWRYEAPVNGPVSFDVTIHYKPDGEVLAAAHHYAQHELSARQSTVSGTRLHSENEVRSHGRQPIRVGGNIKAPTKIRDVRPVYPEVAQQARVSGMVIIEVLIGPEGFVEEAKVLRSIPVLDQAALDAVRQWIFTPTLLNGEPIPVIMTVTVNFTLQ